MRLSFLALLGAMLVGGCSDRNALEGPVPIIPPDSATIGFSHKGTLALAPGALAELEVHTDPPAQYGLSFVLLGDALDASLDKTSVIAGADGRATVTLKAPSTSASFVLRATIDGGSSADLPVAVSSEGFGSLVVKPKYGGNRPVESWHAGVISGKTCASLIDKLPDDPPGALTAMAGKNDYPVIDVAPVGPTLAVYLRAGHYIWGCSDETDLRPDEVETVEVHVVNKPIDASGMLLSTELSFAPEPTAFNTLLSTAASGLFAQLGSEEPGPALLLEAMHVASTDPAGFDAAATQNDWAVAIENHFLQHDVDLVTTLVGYGSAGLAAEPPIISGRLEASPQSSHHARFELDTIGSASQGVFATSTTLSFGIDPDDVVHVGGKIFFLPGLYVAHVIEKEALAQHAPAAAMADVLAELVKCDELSLAGMSSCSGACIASLCRDGVGVMWDLARQEADDATGEIALQISGAAAFDDYAALTGFSGTWLGAVIHAQIEAGVSGPVEAIPFDPGPG